MDALLSLREAAEVSGVSMARLWRLIRRGELPAVRERRRWIVRLSDLRRVLVGPGDRLTLLEAAAELGVTEQRVRVLVARERDQLPAAKVPRLRLDAPLMVRRSDLDRYRQQPRRAGRPPKAASTA